MSFVWVADTRGTNEGDLVNTSVLTKPIHPIWMMQTPNQFSVAHALDQFPSANPLLVTVENQTPAGYGVAIGKLAAEPFAGLSASRHHELH